MNRQRREALKQWFRMVTLPLAKTRSVPRRLESQAGAGLYLTVYGRQAEPAQMVYVCIAPRQKNSHAAIQTQSAELTYVGKEELSATERSWLRAIAKGARRAEKKPDSLPFLTWANGQPAVGLPEELQTDDRITSGAHLLLRLNTECNARCAFCSSHGVLPDLVPNADIALKRMQAARAAGCLGVSLTGGDLIPQDKVAPAVASAVAPAAALGDNGQ